MPELVRLDEIGALLPGSAKVYQVAGREVAVFNIAGTLHAVENRCPHKGAALHLGAVQEGMLTCPLHGWQFDLQTGAGIDRPAARLRRFDVSVDGQDFLLVVPPADSQNGDDGILRYLVRYGALGWIARFGTIEPLDCSRGDRVLVQTERGTEVGEVLATPGKGGGPPDTQQPTGELLRRMTPADELQARQAGAVPPELLSRCERLLADQQLPIEIIDSEELFDRATIVLYFLGEATAELGKLAVELGETQTAKVIFQSVIEREPSGCGSGGGGCCH
jgi:nitrite reductase/ring-hydroxylating ferredoxin subunit